MKKDYIVILMLLYIVILGIITGYKDKARVNTGIEPKYTIKIINQAGNKVTYWGLGYKIIRYVSVSPKESFSSSPGVKFGSWFMEYELPVYWDMNDYGTKEPNFIATIIEVTDDTIIVEPEEGTIERMMGNRFSMQIVRPTSGIMDFYVPGNRVKIYYNGVLIRNYPVLIEASRIELYGGTQ